jgi:hypothetical protein
MRKYSRKELYEFDMDTLKTMAYNMGMRKSNSYQKDKLVRKILRYNLSSEDEKQIRSLGITKLKEKAKQLGISGYSTFKSDNKEDLANKIVKRLKEQEEKSKEKSPIIEQAKVKSPEKAKVKSPKKAKVKSPEKAKVKYTNEELNKLTVVKLKELASELKVYVRSRDKKADIIDMILESKQKETEKIIVKEAVIELPAEKAAIQIILYDDLMAMKTAQLKDLVKERKLKLKDSMTKQDIVDLIFENQPKETEEDKVVRYKKTLIEKGIDMRYLSGLSIEDLRKLSKAPVCNQDNDYSCPDDLICNVDINRCRKDADIPGKYVLKTYKKHPIAGSTNLIGTISTDIVETEEILLPELSNNEIIQRLFLYYKNKYASKGGIKFVEGPTLDVDIQVLAKQRKIDLDEIKKDVKEQMEREKEARKQEELEKKKQMEEIPVWNKLPPTASRPPRERDEEKEEQIAVEEGEMSAEDVELLAKLEQDLSAKPVEEEPIPDILEEEGEENVLRQQDVEDILEEISQERIVGQETLKTVQTKILKCLGLLA